MAIVAVIGLFLKFREKPTSTNTQSANVSGQNNSVNQNSDVSAGGKTEDK